VKIERIACCGEVHPACGEAPAAEVVLAESSRAARRLAEERPMSVQLVYIDPPFNTGQDFLYRQRVGADGYGGDLKRQIAHVAYADRFEGGRGAYLEMMRGVLSSAHALLDAKGSIYVHVDYRTSAHVRLLLDDVFGEDNFVNEIIWHYRSGGRATRHFSRKHDTIFFYRKGPRYRFNAMAASKPRGRERRNHLRRQTDEQGRTFFSIHTKGKLYRYYEDAPVFVSDVWDDISHLHQRDPERTHYDTQKPCALLERIIGVSSDPGDAVADLFCGSGTTLVTAARMGRRSIGIDSSVHALNVCRKRLHGIDAPFCCTCENLPSCAPVYLRVSAGRGERGALKVCLRDFSTASQSTVSQRENRAQQQISWLQHDDVPEEHVFTEPGAVKGAAGIGALDYAALGFVIDGVFHTASAHTRSRKSPELRSCYQAGIPPGARPALHLVDVLGQNHYFGIRM